MVNLPDSADTHFLFRKTGSLYDEGLGCVGQLSFAANIWKVIPLGIDRYMSKQETATSDEHSYVYSQGTDLVSLHNVSYCRAKRELFRLILMLNCFGKLLSNSGYKMVLFSVNLSFFLMTLLQGNH